MVGLTPEEVEKAKVAASIALGLLLGKAFAEASRRTTSRKVIDAEYEVIE